jgi:hypothetical protein
VPITMWEKSSGSSIRWSTSFNRSRSRSSNGSHPRTPSDYN